MKKISTLLIFLVLLFIPRNISSHPHVFIYSSVDAVFDDNGLAGFNIYWKFDEMFSNMFIYDFDKNENRTFEPQELAALKKGAFDNLKKFSYFSHIKIENRRFRVVYVKNFKAWIKGFNLYYSFFVPCHVKAIKKTKDVKIAIYDQSFYCSVFLTRNPLYLMNAENFEVSYQTEKNSNDAYYFSQIIPKEITINFRLKNE